MANEIYQNRVLPDGTINPVAQAQKVNNPLEPLKNTANIMNKLDMQYKRLQIENEKIKQDQFESDLKLRQTQFNSELENITNQQDFDNAISKFNSDIDTLGNNLLGENAYKKWSNEKGRNYKALADLGYRSIWAKNLQKQNYASMQNTVSNYATLAAIDPQRRQDFVAQAEISINDKNLGLTPIQKEALKNKFMVELANAEVVRDINNNPQEAIEKLKAIEKDKNGNIENDRPKFYDGLTPPQRQRYIEQAQRQYEKELNTYKDKKINNLKEIFNNLYQNKGYKEAYQFMQDCINNVDSIVKANDITQEQFQAFKSYASGMLKEQNSDYAQINQDRFGDLQVKMKSLGIKPNEKGDYIVDTKQKRYAENIVEAIKDINDGLKDGTYYINQNQVIKMRSALRAALGVMVDNGVRLRDTDVEGQTFLTNVLSGGGIDGDMTASEYIKDSILNVLNNSTNKNNFNIDKISLKEKGEIFEHVYETALANNIDLKSYYIHSKQKIKDITQDVFNWMIQNKFNVPNKPYNSVIGDGYMYDTHNLKAKNNIGKKLSGYGNYIIDDSGAIKLTDKDGNIIDEVK